MDTIIVQPNEIKLTADVHGVALTAQSSETVLNTAPAEIALNLQAQEVALNLQPNEVVLNVLTGAVINNYYTSGGKVTKEFDHTDFAGGSLLIGEITSGRVIINTVVEVEVAFNSGSFTIGKDSAQAILMAIADRGNEQGRYLTHNYIELTATDNYKIFFSGSPSTGSGKVYITFA